MAVKSARPTVSMDLCSKFAVFMVPAEHLLIVNFQQETDFGKMKILGKNSRCFKILLIAGIIFTPCTKNLSNITYSFK